MISAWLDLLLAGILEVVWSTCLKESHGFSSLPWSVATIAGMLASFWFLAHAVKVLPLGTSYVIWTGIGAVGAFLCGILIFHEPVTLPRCFFAGLQTDILDPLWKADTLGDYADAGEIDYWNAIAEVTLMQNTYLHAEYAFAADADQGEDPDDTWTVSLNYVF